MGLFSSFNKKTNPTEETKREIHETITVPSQNNQGKKIPEVEELLADHYKQIAENALEIDAEIRLEKLGVPATQLSSHDSEPFVDDWGVLSNWLNEENAEAPTIKHSSKESESFEDDWLSVSSSLEEWGKLDVQSANSYSLLSNPNNLTEEDLKIIDAIKSSQIDREKLIAQYQNRGISLDIIESQEQERYKKVSMDFGYKLKLQSSTEKSAFDLSCAALEYLSATAGCIKGLQKFCLASNEEQKIMRNKFFGEEYYNNDTYSPTQGLKK